jgi:asparagine synthase (glutamine-hydrolysing)
MCGIAGFFHLDQSRIDSEQTLKLMANLLSHRGPDSFGTFLSDDANVGLVHTRLSILDLSSSGHQPMVSQSGDSRIVFNGEIYNFLEIRRQLEQAGLNFKTGTDTEILLNAIEVWGVERTLSKCIGMFAFAVWNERTQKIILAKDRLGKKPLYFGSHNGGIFFASELRALRSVAGFSPKIDRASLSAYLKYNYVPTPHSIYEGIHKLEPGIFIEFNARNPGEQTATKYWSVPSVVSTMSNQRMDHSNSENTRLDQLEELLTDSVRLRLQADVQVGCFLSGGIDSSLICAIVAKKLGQSIKSFTIGYRETAYDESKFAQAMARQLGTHHIELILSPKDVQSSIPAALSAFDEPFADSSQLPTYLVCKLARQHVTVALSGDAGDELFGGYNRHVWATKIYEMTRMIPPAMKRFIGRQMKASNASFIDELFAVLNRFVPANVRRNNMGYKLQKVGRVLDSSSIAEVYEFLISYRQDTASMLVDRVQPASLYGQNLIFEGLDEAEQMMAHDSMSYLLDDILVKVDRASMASSLEARAPFLDHRVVEHSWTMPSNFKINGQIGKYPLRKILARYVPADLFERPKTGFGVPIDHWLKTDLREWALELLNSEDLRDLGLESKVIQQEWKTFVEGRERNYERIWNILSLVSWYRAHHASH